MVVFSWKPAVHDFSFTISKLLNVFVSLVKLTVIVLLSTKIPFIPLNVLTKCVACHFNG